MQKTDLILFNKENTREILKDFDFKIELRKDKLNKDREMVLSEDKPVLCHACNIEISVDKVGTIAYGSKLLFCDNPLCLATWIAKNKI